MISMISSEVLSKFFKFLIDVVFLHLYSDCLGMLLVQLVLLLLDRNTTLLRPSRVMLDHLLSRLLVMSRGLILLR